MRRVGIMGSKKEKKVWRNTNLYISTLPVGMGNDN